MTTVCSDEHPLFGLYPSLSPWAFLNTYKLCLLTYMMESKWLKKTFREAVNDVFVKEKFKPYARTKIMLSLLVRFVQTR